MGELSLHGELKLAKGLTFDLQVYEDWPPLVQSCAPCGLCVVKRAAGGWGDQDPRLMTELSRTVAALQWNP